MPSSVIRARDVQGTSVENAIGEHLGHIEDVVIDKARGAVSYVVLSFGGFLGVGSKLIALPWDVLAYSEAEGAYIVNVDKDILRAAEGFDPDDWPEMNEAWRTGIRGHYGLPPEGESEAAAEAASAARVDGRRN